MTMQGVEAPARSGVRAVFSITPRDAEIAERAAQARLSDALSGALPHATLTTVEPRSAAEAVEALTVFCAERGVDEIALFVLHGAIGLRPDGEFSLALGAEEPVSSATLRAALRSCPAKRQIVLLSGPFTFDRDPGESARQIYEATLDATLALTTDGRAALAAPLGDGAADVFALRLALALETGFATTLGAWAQASRVGGAPAAILLTPRTGLGDPSAWRILGGLDLGDGGMESIVDELSVDDLLVDDLLVENPPDLAPPPHAPAPEPAPAPAASPEIGARAPHSLPEMLERRRLDQIEDRSVFGGPRNWGRRAGTRAPLRRKRAAGAPVEPVLPGKLHADAPRRMRVARPQTVSVALTRDMTLTAEQALRGSDRAELSSHDVLTAAVMSVTLGDPEDAFDIRPLSAAMQTIDHEAVRPFLDAQAGAQGIEGAGLWRWRVTPRRSGSYPLTIDANAFVPIETGALIPAPAKNETIAVRVRVNPGLALKTAARWVAIGALGVLVFDLGLRPLIENPERLDRAYEWVRGLVDAGIETGGTLTGGTLTGGAD